MAFAARSSSLAASRAFHTTRPAFVKVGDSVPNLDVLTEKSPGNTVNLAKEFASGDGLIIGVPGAFSPGCSQKHVPSYLKHPNLKDAGHVFVVSVNDPFVMGAWGELLDPTGASGVSATLSLSRWFFFTPLSTDNHVLEGSLHCRCYWPIHQGVGA